MSVEANTEMNSTKVTTAALTLDSVHYAYSTAKENKVVKNVSLQINAGAFHCLVGRSGCGKTTLLKIAAGLIVPTSGQVRLQQTPVTSPMPEMGFVFQSPTLLPWLSVIDNVLLPLQLHQRINANDYERGQQLLARLGLSGVEHSPAPQLSGGQQSRVAIARALITQPSILLMDEPFAALDAITREELQRDLSALCVAEKTAVLFVTHDITEAVYLADHIHVMHQGRLESTLNLATQRPRHTNIRYSPEFNQECMELRQMKDAQS